MASTEMYMTLTYVDAKRLYCAATNCTNVILNSETGHQVFGAFDASYEPHKKVHIDATVYLCNEHMEQVRQGQSPRYLMEEPIPGNAEEQGTQTHQFTNTSNYVIRDAKGNITARSENLGGMT